MAKRVPGVVLVHGWESARDRTLPMAQFLHAAGFHCLTFDVRGHGANGAEALPISAGEFGEDALAAFRTLMARPEVTVGAISGHSMGALGRDPRGGRRSACRGPRRDIGSGRSVPSDPADIPAGASPDPRPDRLATRLADDSRLSPARAATDVPDISATAAIARYRGPVLLAHGAEDAVMPVGHLARLANAAREARAGDPNAAPVETLVVAGGEHSWLYEDAGYRRAVARMLTVACGGPMDPDTAAEIAASTMAERIPDAETRFAAMEETHGGLRTLARVALPGATRAPTERSQPETPRAAETIADVRPAPAPLATEP